MPNQELFPGWAFCICRTILHYESLDLWGYRWIYGVIVRFVGNRWIYDIKNRKTLHLREMNRILFDFLELLQYNCFIVGEEA